MPRSSTAIISHRKPLSSSTLIPSTERHQSGVKTAMSFVLIGSRTCLPHNTDTRSGGSVSALGKHQHLLYEEKTDLVDRKCVGQNFGDKVVKIVLSAIVEKYSVTLKDNYLSENPAMFVHAPSGELILTPREVSF